MLTRTDVFLGRQPILDRQHNVVAYELLFRDGWGDEANVADDSLATACVIQRAFRRLGIRTVVGDRKALINVDAPTLMSRAIEALPNDRVVIELLESIRINGDIVDRCRQLKKLGYRLALDDFFRYEEEYEPLLQVVDIVKIDIQLLDRESLKRLVKRLGKWPTQLLAEKVETWQRARECLKMGFNLFQGFYFGRPVTLTA